MSPDDLLAAFSELAQADRWMRIDYCKIGDDEQWRLAGWCAPRNRATFDLLAADAAARFDPDGMGDPVQRWMRLVWDYGPGPDPHPAGAPRSLGYAILGDSPEAIARGEREVVPFHQATMSNAAGASVLVVRLLRDKSQGAPSTNAPPADSAELPDEPAGPALTANDVRVLKTMAGCDPGLLSSTDSIAEEMGAENDPRNPPLSVRTIGPIVGKLVKLHLAERPEGDRSGARLTTRGRRRALEIAN